MLQLNAGQPNRRLPEQALEMKQGQTDLELPSRYKATGSDRPRTAISIQSIHKIPATALTEKKRVGDCHIANQYRRQTHGKIYFGSDRRPECKIILRTINDKGVSGPKRARLQMSITNPQLFGEELDDFIWWIVTIDDNSVHKIQENLCPSIWITDTFWSLSAETSQLGVSSTGTCHRHLVS